MALIARFGYRLTDVRPADCTAAETVGDFVCISAPQVSNRDQVIKADPADYNKLPAVGVVISKSSATTCLVQWGGETPALFFGLAAGDRYFLGRDGRLAHTPPLPTPDNVFIQPVAVAVATDRVYVRAENNLILRRA